MHGGTKEDMASFAPGATIQASGRPKYWYISSESAALSNPVDCLTIECLADLHANRRSGYCEPEPKPCGELDMFLLGCEVWWGRTGNPGVGSGWGSGFGGVGWGAANPAQD